jgi:sugar (pentulose or hexulose) kinase
VTFAGVGLLEDLATTATHVAHVDATYEPQAANRERYDAQFAIYRQLYPQLKE